MCVCMHVFLCALRCESNCDSGACGYSSREEEEVTRGARPEKGTPSFCRFFFKPALKKSFESEYLHCVVSALSVGEAAWAAPSLRG